MKVKNKTKLIIVTFSALLVFVCTSCYVRYIYSEEYAVKNFIKSYGIKYLDDKNLIYYYAEDGGWDLCDFQYFVFEFEERPTDFIRQFYSVKYPECGFVYSENEEYANSVLKRLESYPEIPEEYKLHFDESYIFRRFPMFYFEKSKKLYIIRFPS